MLHKKAPKRKPVTSREPTAQRKERVQKEKEINLYLNEPLFTEGMTFNIVVPFTPQQAELAIRASGGLIANAAKVLGVKKATFYQLISKYPQLQAAVSKSRLYMSEVAVDNVVEAVMSGDLATSRFWLSRCAPGWEPRTIVEGNFSVKADVDLAKLSDDELEARHRSAKEASARR